jgi:hypothetical protein
VELSEAIRGMSNKGGSVFFNNSTTCIRLTPWSAAQFSTPMRHLLHHPGSMPPHDCTATIPDNVPQGPLLAEIRPVRNARQDLARPLAPNLNGGERGRINSEDEMSLCHRNAVTANKSTPAFLDADWYLNYMNYAATGEGMTSSSAWRAQPKARSGYLRKG